MKAKIQNCLKGERKGFSGDKIASLIHVRRGEHADFVLALGKMEKDGDLLLTGEGRYVLSLTDTVRAKLISLSRGFGFARPENGGADCFIPGRDLGEALPGDTVRIRTEEGDARGPQGAVIELLEKGNRLYSGRLVAAGDKQWEVEPDAFFRYPLPVCDDESVTVAAGDKVRFTVFRTGEGDLAALVLMSYGSADSAKKCADAIIDTAGIPSVFPDEVLKQAETLRAQGIQPEELAGRSDLRSWTIFTIDGPDAKDLDDAVSLEKTGDGGWRLGVHIADVSHYVREHTPLDEEARRRGTSVYFADRVIPMLPEALSNGACSLNAGEDKLTLSAIMTLTKTGELVGVSIRKSVIRSRVRGVYQEINDLFDGKADEAIQEKYAPVMNTLDRMRRLAVKLKRAAAQRGTMDLISSESVFVLDEQGHPANIFSRTSGESEEMIEQFMIAANVAVAAYARRQDIPFVYRIHEQPDTQKLRALSETARSLGFKHAKLGAQKDMRAMMEEARDTAYARLVSERLLRSMAKARYSEKPIGHFGLALKDYCHFTSPIRRYPDLAVHRILTDVLAGTPKEQVVQHYEGFVRESSGLSSQCEVRAMMAERNCEDCYKAEYMSRFIGEEFDGIISSVSAFGLYVELPNSVEGMVRLENLPEKNLRYDDVASFTDSRGKPVYTVGGAMRVRVDGTNVSSGRIDFSSVQKK